MSEIFENGLHLLKKTTDIFNDMKKEKEKKIIEITSDQQTETFIQYLHTTYTEEQIKEKLGTTVKEYIQKKIHSDDDTIDKISTIGDIINPKLELKALKDKIKPIKNQVESFKKIISNLEGEEDPIISSIEEYITIEPHQRAEWLQQRGIIKKQEEINLTKEVVVVSPNVEPPIIPEETNDNIQTYQPINKIQELSPEKKEKEAYKYLLSIGYKHIQAAAIVGNIKIESNFNVNAIGDHGTAHGICQRRGDRLENLKKFAETKGKNWKDFYTQIDFMKQESSGRTSGYESKFLAAKTVKEATEIFDKNYERSDGKSIAARIQRAVAYEKNMNIA